MAAHSKSAVVKALVGNGVITIGKFVAWLFSGSGSMLSESIHSLVDTLNQGLLLIGQSRAMQTPTLRYPYGFGVEANFWGLLAAIGILVFGGGLSIEHGLESLTHPEVPTNLLLSLIVLAFALGVEGWVLLSVVRDLQRTRGERGFWEHVRRQGPGTVTVLLEDAAAVSGVLVAAIAIVLCKVTGDGIYDAWGQIIIGVMLAAVGLYLVIRNRGMIIGMALPPAQLKRIQMYLEDLEGIDRVTDLKTRQLGLGRFRLKAEVVFSGGFLAGPLVHEYGDKLADCTEPAAIREVLGRYSDALMERLAAHVDKLEDEIRAHYPDAMHIDLEPHVRDV